MKVILMVKTKMSFGISSIYAVGKTHQIHILGVKNENENDNFSAGAMLILVSRIRSSADWREQYISKYISKYISRGKSRGKFKH